VLGGSGDPRTAVRRLAAELPHGPVVAGPVVPDLERAAGCVREALAGLQAVAAWPDAPRPVRSDELLAERVVLGDPTARERLLEEVHRPLVGAGGDLALTAAAFLDGGGSIEGAARALFVHPNTVRYRLRRIAETIGYDLGEPRHAQVVRLALVLGRVAGL
jgi:DNA-binding PucR family transcriptional regulator